MATQSSSIGGICASFTGSTSFQQRLRFLNQEDSVAQLLLQAVRILRLKPSMWIFHSEERLPPFPSQVSIRSCSLTCACKHMHTLVSLLTISAHWRVQQQTPLVVWEESDYEQQQSTKVDKKELRLLCLPWRDEVAFGGREVWISCSAREKEQCDWIWFYHHEKGKYSGSE